MNSTVTLQVPAESRSKSGEVKVIKSACYSPETLLQSGYECSFISWGHRYGDSSNLASPWKNDSSEQVLVNLTSIIS